MKLNIKKPSDLLQEDLTITERGILITILLSRGEDPSFTLFKTKKKLDFRAHKDKLISLHERGFIEWSGYAYAKSTAKRKEAGPQITSILSFMNNLYRRKFGPTENRVILIEALLKKYTEEEIKKVIANRYSVWKDDAVMIVHLVPETVFRMSKFTKYLDAVKHTREGESFLNASQIDLKEGQEITYDISQSFIDTEVYTFKSYNLNSTGRKMGIGITEKRYGKDIKKLLNVQKNSSVKTLLLIYIQE